MTNDKVPVSSLFLDNDERYDVFAIKLAERPQLAHYVHDRYENDTPPLTDGYHLEGWSKIFAFADEEITAILNVGAACHLRRRESQLCPLPRHVDWKKRLSQELWNETPDVDRLTIQEACRLNSQSVNQFEELYEIPNRPVIIVEAAKDWKASSTWSFDDFSQRFGNVNWRFSDTHGEVMTMDAYKKYINGLEGQTDDSPLGIYDSEFGNETSPTNVLVDEYAVPPCFSPDLFASCEKHRPPWRWILMGPPRSGTGMHIDPLYTNAWVTLLVGCKRWMLFPPETCLEQIGLHLDMASVIWFQRYFAKVTDASFPWRPIQILQHPGDTVFVPNRWPHVVLNLEASLAVTHNYACEHHFDQIWPVVEQEEPELFKEWLESLKSSRPDLVQRVKSSVSHQDGA